MQIRSHALKETYFVLLNRAQTKKKSDTSPSCILQIYLSSSFHSHQHSINKTWQEHERISNCSLFETFACVISRSTSFHFVMIITNLWHMPKDRQHIHLTVLWDSLLIACWRKLLLDYFHILYLARSFFLLFFLRSCTTNYWWRKTTTTDSLIGRLVNVWFLFLLPFLLVDNELCVRERERA